MRDLKNLEPAIKALADVGPDIGKALQLPPSTSRYGPALVDRAVKGDYVNLFEVFDLTVSAAEADAVPRYTMGRRKRQTRSGTGRSLVPADTYEPMNVPLNPPPEAARGAASLPGEPMPPVTGPVLPVVPPPTPCRESIQTQAGPLSPIFAGPYGAQAPPPPPDPAAPPVPPAAGSGG